MKKSVALFFLFVFCVSLPGFSVELHYCKGTVTDISFFGHANCLCEDSEKNAEHKKSEKLDCQKHCHGESVSPVTESMIKLQKACCKTEKLTMTSSKLKAFSGTKKVEVLYAVAVLNPYALAELVFKTNQVVSHYLPPQCSRDLSVLNSVFII